MCKAIAEILEPISMNALTFINIPATLDCRIFPELQQRHAFIEIYLLLKKIKVGG